VSADAAARLRQLADSASGAPWTFNENNHLIVSDEPDRVAFADLDTDGRLIALAPELARLAADMADALVLVRDWVREGRGSEADAAEALDSVLARVDTLTKENGA
jgi:hypothetical protein